MAICKVDGCENISKAKGYCNLHYQRYTKFGNYYTVKNVVNKKIDFEIVNGCFECTSHRLDKCGYPHLNKGKKHYLVHRYIYEQCFGPIEDNLVVRHKCDNPKCINPEHLELGTFLDNMYDRINRGRTSKGEENGQSKLTTEQVREIRKLIGNGEKIINISKKFNISPQNVCDIRARRSWKHVD